MVNYGEIAMMQYCPPTGIIPLRKSWAYGSTLSLNRNKNLGGYCIDGDMRQTVNLILLRWIGSNPFNPTYWVVAKVVYAVDWKSIDIGSTPIYSTLCIVK